MKIEDNEKVFETNKDRLMNLCENAHEDCNIQINFYDGFFEADRKDFGIVFKHHYFIITTDDVELKVKYNSIESIYYIGDD
jgi:hypothetical protein